MRKANKPIHALAATRARLGLTQAQIAEQLGISHIMVRLIETNRRFLSSDALVKLAALEISLAAMPPVSKTVLPSCVKELYEEDNKEYAMQTDTHELDCSYKAMQLERKLQKMQADHTEIISSLHNIEAVSKKLDDNAQVKYNLWLNQTRLLQKLSRCSPQQQAIVKNRIAMLYAEVSLKRSIHPRYVHTNEKPTIS